MSLIVGIKLKAIDGLVYHFVTNPQQQDNPDAVTLDYPSSAHLLLEMFEPLYDGVHGRDLLSVAELVEPALARRARLEASAYKTEIFQVLSHALMNKRLSFLRMPETKSVIAHEEQPTVPAVENQTSLPKAGQVSRPTEGVGKDAVRSDIPAVPLSETAFCGDPVSMVTGEEVLLLTDVTITGGHSLEWGRIYRSGQCDIDVGMGFGWRSVYQYELAKIAVKAGEETTQQWCFTDNEGSTLHFDTVEIGAVSYQVRAGASLYHHPENYHLLRLKDGRQLRFSWLHGAWRMDKLRISQTVQYGFQYSTAGRMTGIDINGHLAMVLRYDRSGHLISVEVPQAAENDPILVLASYQYDESGHQVSATNRHQQTEHYQYRADHLLTSRTRASGFCHYFEWIGESKNAKCCVQYGDNGNYHYQFDYDEQSKVTVSTDSRGHQWQHRHNEQGLLIEKVSPKGARWQYRYNQLGLKVAEETPNGGVSHYRYNHQGLLAELEAPNGELTTFRYNRFGQCVEQKNALGQVTSHRFNSLGLLLATCHPDGREDEYHYDHQGRLVKHHSASGELFQYWWNANGLLDAIKVNNALTRYSYDNASEINGIAYPDGQVLALHRDGSGNISKTSQYHPDSDEPAVTQSYEYDQAGRLISYTDPIGRTLGVVWGGLSQPEMVIQADGSQIDFQYDNERNLVGIKRSDGCCYQLEWDEEERLSRTVGFDGRDQNYRYDENGELIELQEADRNVRIQRDIVGRVTTMFAVSASGTRDSIQFHYDDANRLINANTATRKLRQEWLLHSHPVAIWQDHHQFQYGFNRQGLRQQLVLADSQNIIYQYDANQQLSQILLTGEVIFDISRDDQGRESQRQQGNGFNLDTHYDEQGRLSHQQWNTPLSDKKSSHERHYFYDQASQLTRIHDRHLGEHAFCFDALNQLQSHRVGLDIHRYQFDSFGNPVSESSVVEQDRLLANKDTAFNYDRYGNQILSRSQSATQHRQFNGFNQLVQVNHQGRTSFYEYDAQGRRSRKVTEQETVDFLWDGDQLIGEYQQGQYRWYIYAPNDFTPLALIDNGEVYYFHTDHQGTPLTITDSRGETVWQANYCTFGFADITIEKIKNPLRYQGQYFDDESGLHYNRFRYYDPITGRFIHQDPIGLLGGINHYRYASNPVQWIDPLGLSCKEGTDVKKHMTALPLKSMAVSIEGPLINSIAQLLPQQLALLGVMQNSVNVMELLPEIKSTLSGKLPDLSLLAQKIVDPVTARKERYQKRLNLLDKTKNISELEHANTRLSMNNDSILRAEAAEYVYRVDEYRRGHISNLPKPPVGLEVIDGDNIPSLKGSVFTDKKSGFGAALFKSEINGETMLTFRGTNNGVTGLEDWKTNGLQGIGRETEQYNQAMNLAKDVKYNIDDDFTIVGHSLGGGLASAAVGVTGISGYTYNAAGLHSNTAARKAGLPNDKVVNLITTQSVEGEILTMVQKHGDKALTTIGAGIGAMAYGQAGAVIGAAAAGLLADVPQAIGTMYSLPSVDGGSSIDKHGMDQVIGGIEAQKEEDLNALSSYMDR